VAATIVTANQYVLDACAGAVVVLCSLGIVERWWPRAGLLPWRRAATPALSVGLATEDPPVSSENASRSDR
jgi:hypothetical protein